VLVPLIKRLERDLGEERARDLVRGALADHYRELASALAEQRGSLGAMQAFGEVSSAGGAIDIEIRQMSDTAADFDITGCRYAQFFQQIGEPELGFLLVCSADVPMSEGIPGVELERTQTIMQGAEFCDFRYRFLGDKLTPPPTGA
jgi:hypothetical protein